MKIALITPRQETLLACRSKQHMALAHLVSGTRGSGLQYGMFYKTLPSHHFVTLDNGVYENDKSVTTEDLVKAAMITGANEIILADVMKDSTETIHKTNLMFMGLIDHAPALNDSNVTHVMFVPQGRTCSEWINCLTMGMHSYAQFLDRSNDVLDYPPTLTIGLAKHHAVTIGRIGYLSLLKWYQHNMIPHKLHLLGWPDTVELKLLMDRYSWVRSMDTARPIVRAMHGQECDNISAMSLNEDHYPRHEDYFDRTLTEPQFQNAEHNIGVLLDAVR